MVSADDEKSVSMTSPMPKGYAFVRKGNVYITKHCRKLTQEANKTVYTVENWKGQKQGLRVPQYIYDRVRGMNAETQQARADAVRKKDTALETKVRQELLVLFPKVPVEAVDPILKHTLKKRSGRVGRNKDMPVKEMVMLAVRAHIRHQYTNYDALLRQGTDRLEARDIIASSVDKKVSEWGGNVRYNAYKSTSPEAKNELANRKPHPKAPPKQNPLKVVKYKKPETLQSIMSARGGNVPRRRSLRVEELQDRAESEDLDIMDLD